MTESVDEEKRKKLKSWQKVSWQEADLRVNTLELYVHNICVYWFDFMFYFEVCVVFQDENNLVWIMTQQVEEEEEE